MIRVRGEQLQALARGIELEQLEDDMVDHLRAFAGRHAEVIGDAWLRRTIALGVERAAAYGITNPGLVKLHLEMMATYGSAFDVDPLHAWASEILCDRSLDPADETSRVDRLYDALLAYRDRVDGPDGKAPVRALENIRRALQEGATPELADEARGLQLLTRVYPERCAYLGAAPLVALLRRAPEAAAQSDLATPLGVGLCAGLLFVIGPAFAADPLFPWISATLRDPAIKSPGERADRLQRRVGIYLERAAQHIERKRADVDL